MEKTNSIVNENQEEITILQPSKEEQKIDPKEASVLDLLLVFTSIQGERVQWFQELNKYFQQYIQNEIDAEVYKNKNLVLTDLQKKFKHHSLTLIRSLKDEHSFNRQDLAMKLESILVLERNLLEATAHLQTAIILDKTSEQDYSEDKISLEKKINLLKSDISDAMIELHEDMADLYE